MSRKKQQQNETMTPMQHRAVLVCILCVLAVLLTFGITTILLKKEEPAPSVSESVADPTSGEDLSGHYQIDNASTALLTETADAGTDYLNDTLFLGDSNTVRLYNNGLISLQQFCAKEGIGTQVALSEGIVTFKKDSNHYTIPQAVAMMKPRRVVMTFGTNDTGMEVSDFIAHYTALIQAIQQSYPYTDIIVNTVPPVPADHSNYPHMDQAKIDDFNMALLDLCEQLGVRFLNSAEALKGSDGYGIADYYTSGDIHLKSAGLKAVLNYLRTHALQTEDRRPDTNNIPTRTMEYVSNPSSAVAAPSSEAVSSSESQAESASSSESSSSESTSEDKKYEARYRVDKNGGGTLSVGNDTGNSSVTYTVTDPDKSITVTAVPAEGHVFVKWSDGLTSKTRTDTDFKQNLDVTAVFGTASVHITSEGKGAVGSSYTFKAALSGKYAKTENLRWYANGQEVTQAAGKSSITVVVDSSMANASYKIHAVVTYNDCKVSSNTLTITIGSGVTSESGSTSSSSSSHAGSSGSTSSSSASSGSSSHSTSSSSSASSSTSSGSSKAESESESKAESKAESKTESKAESKAESEAESKSESKAESKAESKSEASASKEAESKAE
ncbi:SGNH/GDSL hydrolase family protein [Faecalibacterium longum]|uniref:SGNH/GDSL hydrolase family protein n=1 Tax=Faecalibacterium longum TaxID=1851428 RepID=UPI001D0F0BF8|nr:SGNH/GDSL hydrolase family protein [Faecalibacterium longum]MCC2141130.1 GDSL-type esterase/lipase family protein [Faecalibacterium longum CLA-AA-H243]